MLAKFVADLYLGGTTNMLKVTGNSKQSSQMGGMVGI